MILLNRASVRTAIDVASTAAIAERVAAGDPNALTTAGMQSLLGDSPLVLDGLRQRPRYFDGRFLTGADLTRDQDYVRQRQADMARASGTGVVAGLQVSLLDGLNGTAVRIEAGQGTTPSGDLVLITAPLQVDMSDLPRIDQLDAALGLRLRPTQPLARRTGLFILALRTVEFTANPIASYPTSITGPRSIEDGDIIEATAVTLIPYPDPAGAASLDEARRMTARKIFVEGASNGIPQDALPLAMLALSGGVIQWLDMAMVRRETGAETALQAALNGRPRALAEAHVLQYDAQLAEVVAMRTRNGATGSFPAAQYFAALPPAGKLPAELILSDSFGFLQAYFPSAIAVDLSFVPADEIPALVDESLALPPIDLLADPADLTGSGIVVLVPVTRQRLQTLETQLGNLTRPASAADVPTAWQTPIALLGSLLQRRLALTNLRAPLPALAPPPDPAVTAWQAAWRAAIAANPDPSGLLWYVRRRSVAYESQLVGVAVAVSGDDAAFTAALDARLDTLGLTARVAALRDRATPFADARLSAFLGAPRIAASDLLLPAAVGAVEAQAAALPMPADAVLPPVAVRPGVRTLGAPTGISPLPPILTRPGTGTPVGTPATPGTVTTPGTDPTPGTASSPGTVTTPGTVRPPGPPAPPPPPLTEAAVLAVVEAFGDPALGDGLSRLFAAMGDQPLTAEQLQWLAASGHVLDLDQVALSLPDANLPGFAQRLGEVAAASDNAGLETLLATGH